MNPRRKVVLATVAGVSGTGALIAVIAVACSTTTSNTPPPPLGSCTTGWFAAQPVGACTATCTTPATPECGAADCQEYNIEGFLQNGVLIDVIVSYSPTKGTMSTFTDYVKRSYQLGDTTIQETPPGTATAAQCIDTNSFTLQGYAKYVRVPAALGTALDRQYASGATHWSGASVTQ